MVCSAAKADPIQVLEEGPNQLLLSWLWSRRGELLELWCPQTPSAMEELPQDYTTLGLEDPCAPRGGRKRDNLLCTFPLGHPVGLPQAGRQPLEVPSYLGIRQHSSMLLPCCPQPSVFPLMRKIISLASAPAKTSRQHVIKGCRRSSLGRLCGT